MPVQIDKAKLLKWIDENWEMERTSGSIAGAARAIVWHEFNDKVRSGDLDVDSIPVSTLQKGDKDTGVKE